MPYVYRPASGRKTLMSFGVGIYFEGPGKQAFEMIQ